MALIHALETNSGAKAVYWRIIQINQNIDRLEVTVDLAGYLDEAARRDGKYPLASVAFNFRPGDHPLEELDPDLVVETLLADWRNVDQHLCYLHIKSIAALASAKKEEDRSSNEIVAMTFVGAVDKLEEA